MPEWHNDLRFFGSTRGGGRFSGARQAGGHKFEPCTAHTTRPVDSRCQRVFSFDSVSTYGDGIFRLNSSAALAILSRIDCNVHGLPLVGTSTGTSGQGVKSSVPVALRATAAVCGPCPERERRQRIHRPGHVQAASDRCTCSWSSRSWNDAWRLVPSAAIPRPCSTSCRRCAAGHERQPFGRVRPACRSSTCPVTLPPGERCPRQQGPGRGFGPACPAREQRRIGRQRRHGRQRQTKLPLSARRIALVAFSAFLVFRVESNRRRSSGGFLQSRCLVGKPLAKIGGKIGPKGIVDPSRFFSSAASSTR
jgi:hypothetical protein